MKCCLVQRCWNSGCVAPVPTVEDEFIILLFASVSLVQRQLTFIRKYMQYNANYTILPWHINRKTFGWEERLEKFYRDLIEFYPFFVILWYLCKARLTYSIIINSHLWYTQQSSKPKSINFVQISYFTSTVPLTRGFNKHSSKMFHINVHELSEQLALNLGLVITVNTVKRVSILELPFN